MNSKYTDQELLLLSNYVYIPVCLSDEPIGHILDTYRDEGGGFSPESVAAAAAGGGMTPADVATVFTKMDEHVKEDPGFGRLSASRTLEALDVRAVCFTDEKDENAVVAFRGTGGTKEAWIDNFEGAYTEDTRIQKIADDFVRYECAVYDEIEVTGHSKGGNMAMYTTVMNHDRIKGCVSFDGQGFPEEFIEKYPDLISEASPDIVSVSAYNDFVNILLASIAGTCIYVANGDSAADAHSSVTLLTYNSFDENGDFTSTRDQGVVAKALSHLTKKMCDGLDPLDVKDKEEMSTIAGSAISLALTTPQDSAAEGVAAPTLGMVTAMFAKKVAAAHCAVEEMMPLAAQSVYIDTDRIKGAVSDLLPYCRMIKRMEGSVDEVRRTLSSNITSKIIAERSLEAICEDLDGIYAELDRKIRLYEAVIAKYEACENRAAALMSL